jgi:hypothetical protein
VCEYPCYLMALDSDGNHGMTSSNQVFDYVIVGAGSAGCVLASRLTEDAPEQSAEKSGHVDRLVAVRRAGLQQHADRACRR